MKRFQTEWESDGMTDERTDVKSVDYYRRWSNLAVNCSVMPP